MPLWSTAGSPTRTVGPVRSTSEEHAAVAFADLAGFTALTDAHGDADALEVADRLFAIAERVTGEHVRVVKTIGDAVMLASGDAALAVTAVFNLVAAVHVEPRFPMIKVGLDAGPVLVRDGDLFGRTVNVASRVASVAEPGHILGTDPIAAAAAATGCAETIAVGPVSLRNIPDPVRLFEVRRCDRGFDEHTAVDPVCRMRVGTPEEHPTRTYAGRAWYFCSEECADRFVAEPTRFVVGL